MLKDGVVSVFLPFTVQFQNDILGTTSTPWDDGGAPFVAASLGLPGNTSIPISADAKGIPTSADMDTAYVDFEE